MVLGGSVVFILDDVITIQNELNGALYGTAAIAGNPDTPVYRSKIQVYVDRGMAFPDLSVTLNRVRIAWSDESGAWGVAKLDPAKKYHVVTHDPAGQYDPVIKLNLVPSVD